MTVNLITTIELYGEIVKRFPFRLDIVAWLVAALRDSRLWGASRDEEVLVLSDYVGAYIYNLAAGIVPCKNWRHLFELHLASGNIYAARGDATAAYREYNRAFRAAFGGDVTELVAVINRGNMGAVKILCAPSELYQYSVVLYEAIDGQLFGEAVNSESLLLVDSLLASFLGLLVKHWTILKDEVEKTGDGVNRAFLPYLVYTRLVLLYEQGLPAYDPVVIREIALHLARVLADTYGGQEEPIVFGDRQIRIMNGVQVGIEYIRWLCKFVDNEDSAVTTGKFLRNMSVGDAKIYFEELHALIPTNKVIEQELANTYSALAAFKSENDEFHEAVQLCEASIRMCPDLPCFLLQFYNIKYTHCDWNNLGGNGAQYFVDENGRLKSSGSCYEGLVERVVSEFEKSIANGQNYGKGILKAVGGPKKFVEDVTKCLHPEDPLRIELKNKADHWEKIKKIPLANEGGWVIRVTEKVTRALQRKWYYDSYGRQYNDIFGRVKRIRTGTEEEKYKRPTLPPMLERPEPTPLDPFTAFNVPMTARQVRLCAHRYALAISYDALKAECIPKTVIPPPPPPAPRLKIGYVSSDLHGRHPMAHLVSNMFGMHERLQFEVFVYATCPNDGSRFRNNIETQLEAGHVKDVMSLPMEELVQVIHKDGIHILVNLNGHTAGDRNHLFSARVAPIQIQHMGFCGSCGGDWIDYFISDNHITPANAIASNFKSVNSRPGDILDSPDPEEADNDWCIYEKVILMPNTYFATDYRQSFNDTEEIPQKVREDPEQLWLYEQDRRWDLRKKLFPNIADDSIILATFNQLYKLDPCTFRIWCNILQRSENAYLWVLEYPRAGALKLIEYARIWCSESVAKRILTTEKAPKDEHVYRTRIADLLLDMPKVNAHTTAADTLWSGTPILTCSGEVQKTASRVAHSIASATGVKGMTVTNMKEYEERAVQLVRSVKYKYREYSTKDIPKRWHRVGEGELIEMRKKLFLGREKSALFDTPRYVKDMEKGFLIAWRQWISGQEKNIIIKKD
ncbi:11687_t:CDS:1 [Paraglomus brasilianum]|uniref:11687_t:CDS:1 n=1 Tax=Paraglomus brasilianum TaxID=144538 RepID=A0A9N8Z2Y0_9GLOM|nr:11687_t:CDS:1 [Paraglomus brasilianum]